MAGATGIVRMSVLRTIFDAAKSWLGRRLGSMPQNAPECPRFGKTKFRGVAASGESSCSCSGNRASEPSSLGHDALARESDGQMSVASHSMLRRMTQMTRNDPHLANCILGSSSQAVAGEWVGENSVSLSSWKRVTKGRAEGRGQKRKDQECSIQAFGFRVSTFGFPALRASDLAVAGDVAECRRMYHFRRCAVGQMSHCGTSFDPESAIQNPKWKNGPARSSCFDTSCPWY